MLEITTKDNKLAAPKFFEQWKMAEFVTTFSSPNTRKTYAKRLLSFFNFCQKRRIYFPREVAVFHINIYRESLVLGQASESSIHLSMSVLSSYFKFLQESRLVDRVPVLKSHLKKSGRRKVLTEPFTGEDYRYIKKQLGLLPLFPRLCLELFVSTGLRFSEIRNLRSSDLKKENEIYYFETVVKGGKLRKIILNDRLKAILGEWMALIPNAEFILSNPNQISEGRLRRIIGRALIGCKKKYRPHSFRVNFITTMAENNVPIDVIAEMVTHADVNMTARYIKRQNEVSQERQSLMNQL